MNLIAIVRHGDGSGVSHMDGNSVWMFISMVAFLIFLLSIAWTLLRRQKRPERSPGDGPAERYAHGEIDDDEFQRAVRDLGPSKS